MRRKDTAKTASPKDATENANRHSKAREAVLTRRPNKTRTGIGLGKAGAKRLGRLLKRAIQDQVESTGRGKASLPKTPFRLFTYQIQTKIESAPRTNSAKLTPADPRDLILNVVSQCRHRGGISMAELKQALAAGGYDVTKNNRRVNAVTQRLVNNDTLIQTTRSVTFRINNKKIKKQPETKQVRTRTVKSPKPKGDAEQRKNTSRSPKGAEKSQRPARKSTQPKGKISQTSKSHEETGETLKPAATSHKPDGKTLKPAAKSRNPRKKTPNAKGKSPKPERNKHGSATNQAAQVHKAPRKTQRAQRRQPKQTRRLSKSSQKRQPLRRSKRLVVRRRVNYY